MLEWLKQKASNVQSSLKQEVTRFRNRDFLEAVIAGCALVAYADGHADAAEKQKMMGFLRTSEALSVFEVSEVISLFDKYTQQLDFDHSIGEAAALQAVGKLRSKESESRLLVRVCCAIGASDGNFDDKERQVAARICRELGLNPSEFDL